MTSYIWDLLYFIDNVLETGQVWLEKCTGGVENMDESLREHYQRNVVRVFVIVTGLVGNPESSLVHRRSRKSINQSPNFKFLGLSLSTRVWLLLSSNSIHTTPEWANQQKSCPEKWYTTYCQGPLGLPKNAFGQIWELNFQEKITFYWFVRKCQTKPCSW